MKHMKRMLGVVAVLIAAATLSAFAAVPFAEGSSGKTIFEFETMVGVSGSFLGAGGNLRGFGGGGAPWIISEGEARLKDDGRLRVKVEGLVLDPAVVPPPLGGMNPAPFFFATLSCLTTPTTVVNITTATVPATTTGDAEIDEVVSLPATCFAPLLFVRGSFSPTGASVGPWFAMAGF